MKILKKGNLDLLKKTKLFICEKCKCEFEADIGEYSTDNQYNETYYLCKCPTCKNTVYSNERN